MSGSTGSRRLPVGAEPRPGGGVHFRVWAPKRQGLEVVLDDASGTAVPLASEGNGYFSGVVEQAGIGSRYRFRMPDESMLLPDPASRFQPDGPHGPSQVVDPLAFRWTDGAWKGIEPERRVLYEMHVGSFTPEGSWTAATERLPDLADLGVTLLEVMPVADFPGRFGWGYDGVNLFAPTRLYGEPDDFRRFVDQAHALGLGVILDVVYNHLGPDGNYLGFFSDHYFTDRYDTEWGEPFDVDGPDSAPVREYLLANVEHWIAEYHLDGLRLDATQSIFDAAERTPHIIAEIARVTREAGAGRELVLVGENEPQRAIHLRPPEQGGYGLDALWNDDWHHSSVVALTGRTEAYYSDYLGAPQEFVSAAKYGFLYQGQHYLWQKKRRGTAALDLPPLAFVHFLQNHDQLANSARGDRIHTLSAPGPFRAMTALLILGPATPMLFMGQEFASSSPFLYFADHEPQLAAAVAGGREKFLAQFPSIGQTEVGRTIPDPADPDAFRRCILDHAERETNAPVFAMHRDLLRLRRDDPTLRAADLVDGAVLGTHAFLLRWFGAEEDGTGDRLLVVNLGRELRFAPAPEPLLAPPDAGLGWKVAWSSENPAYGGLGHPAPESEDGRWVVPAGCAMLLAPRAHDGGPRSSGGGSTTDDAEDTADARRPMTDAR